MEIKAEDIIGWRDEHGNVYCDEHGDVENMEPVTEDDYGHFEGIIICDEGTCKERIFSNF